MKKIYLMKYGELSLKGKNLRYFEDMVANNTMHALTGFNVKIQRSFTKFFIEAEVADEAEHREIVKIISTRVFGLANVTPGDRVPNTEEAIFEKAAELAHLSMQENPGWQTYRVETRRIDKKFPVSSMDMNKATAEHLFDHGFDKYKVKLKNSDLTVFIEIYKDHAFIATEKVNCLRGMPVDKYMPVGLLLSGGIDSPVAGFLAQKRGCYLNCIYFHSPPYTTEKAKEKVMNLARVLKNYQKSIRLYVVNFTEIQLTMRQNTKADYFVLLGRRMMMRISNALAAKHGFKALVTGENLGQVASQTIENLHCINEIAVMPVLRPIICFDKDETVLIAKKIGTYDISILPYDDCCSLFLPPSPETRAIPKYLEEEELKVNIEELVNMALEKTEIIDL